MWLSRFLDSRFQPALLLAGALVFLLACGGGGSSSGGDSNIIRFSGSLVFVRSCDTGASDVFYRLNFNPSPVTEDSSLTVTGPTAMSPARPANDNIVIGAFTDGEFVFLISDVAGGDIDVVGKILTETGCNPLSYDTKATTIELPSGAVFRFNVSYSGSTTGRPRITLYNMSLMLP